MRVALVHDWLTGMRGGERVLHELASMYPEADLYTLVHVPGSTSDAIDALRIHPSPLSGLPGIENHYRKLLPFFPWAIRQLDLSGHDLVISCSHAVAKGARIPERTPHLCYCLTPMRYVWDQIDAYQGRGLKRTLARPLTAALRSFDRRTSAAAAVTRFVAISSEVKERISRCYGRSSELVFPPVDTDRIRPNERAPEDFYLLVGGFVPYKNESLAIEACRRLGRNLVVVGDGPGHAQLAAEAPTNARFLGRVSDAELAQLYASCRALLYPQEEDFGIAAVEAQAAGRPVIAFGRGGARDTVIPARDPGAIGSATGVVFELQTVDAMVDAILRFEAIEERFDAGAIRKWAEGFGVARFRRELQHEVELTLAALSGA